MERIDKDKVLKYLNISDSIYIVCVIIGLLFFGDTVIRLLAIWLVTFLCSSLGLRRYCKGKPMMKYGTINDEDIDDNDGIISSYHAHRWTIALGTIGAVFFTVYQTYLNCLS